jgi:hypothetical protein
MKGRGSTEARVLAGPWAGAPASVPVRKRLDVALLDLRELVRQAFGEPRDAEVLMVALAWSQRRPDRQFLFEKLPWLREVEDAERIAGELLENGWVLLKCGSRDVAERLCSTRPGA